MTEGRELKTRKSIFLRFMCSAAVLIFLLGCGEPLPVPLTPLEKGLKLIAAKEYTKAVQKLESLTGEDEQDWRPFHYLGICFEKMGRRNRAVDYYLNGGSYFLNSDFLFGKPSQFR